MEAAKILEPSSVVWQGLHLQEAGIECPRVCSMGYWQSQLASELLNRNPSYGYQVAEPGTSWTQIGPCGHQGRGTSGSLICFVLFSTVWVLWGDLFFL